jgi:hypothetical protein
MKYQTSNKFDQVNFDKLLFILSVVLFVIAAIYLTKGFYILLLSSDQVNPQDLFTRWQEQQYIYHQQYPYYARVGSKNIIPEIGPIISGGYFPWSFFTGFFLVPNISWPLVRIYYTFLNIICLVIIGFFSYNVGLPYGKPKALFCLAASLAISSNCTILGVGQYGLIINGFLVGFFLAIKHYKYSWSGLFLGMAMIKPNISALYFFILMARRGFTGIIVFLIYLIFSSLFISLAVKVDVLKMIEEVFSQTKYFATTGSSTINYFVSFGIDTSSAVLISGIVAMLISMIIFYLCRSYDLLTLFAIAGVIARVSTYHLNYDNVMLIFLLLAIIKMTLIKPDKLNFLVMLVVGFSLWMPARTINFHTAYITSIQFSIWLFALGYLMFQEKQRKLLEVHRV